MHWRDLARRQSGVITRAQLAAAGATRHVIARMLRCGELVRLSSSVYLVGGAPLTYAARLWSAVLATEGALGVTTAGRLWGVYDGTDDTVHVMLGHDRRAVAPPGVVIHRCGWPRGALRTRSGLPVTSRAWTVLDLLATLSAGEASRLADRSVQRGWLTPSDLTTRLELYPHRPGNAQLRRLATTFGDGAAAQSERILHRLLRRAGITGWVANQEIWAAGELIAVVDVAIPARRIAIEVDGMAYHVDVDRFRRDRSRQNALVALGWTVLRFTWADLTERPGYVLATLARVAA